MDLKQRTQRRKHEAKLEVEQETKVSPTAEESEGFTDAQRDDLFCHLAQHKRNRFAAEADTLAQPILSVVRDAWYTGLRDSVLQKKHNETALLPPAWSVGNSYR
jgi:hypothetical protein